MHESEQSVMAASRGYLKFFFEGLFWIGMGFWGFFPNRHDLFIPLFGVPINFKEIILFGIFLGYFVFYFGSYSLRKLIKENWDNGAKWYLLALFFYTCSTLAWAKINSTDFLPMLFSLPISFASFCAGYLIISVKNERQINGFLLKLSFIIVFISLVYALDTFFSIGFRSNLDWADKDFGIARASGPLYYVSTGGFILIPVLGYLIYRLFQIRKNKIFVIISIFILILSVMATGSRAALGGILMTVFLGILFYKKTVKGLIVGISLLTFILVGILVIGTKANMSRYEEGISLGRLATYSTAINCMDSLGMKLAIGNGYGSVWAYRKNSLENVRNWRGNLIDTDFGKTLFHPHSDILDIAVQMGLVGLVLYLIFWLKIINVAFANRKTPIVFWCASFLSTFVLINFETYFFMRNILTFLWLTYLFALLKIIYYRRSQIKTGK